MYIHIYFELSLMVFIWTANTNCSGKGNSEKGGAGLGRAVTRQDTVGVWVWRPAIIDL